MATRTSKVKAMMNLLGAAADSLDTLSGAVDIIVLRCRDGSLRSSAFICRFGRFNRIRSNEKIVRIEVNGKLNPDVYMKIGPAGEAYFIAAAEEPVQMEPVASQPSPLGQRSLHCSCNSAGESLPAHAPLSSLGLRPADSPPSVPSNPLSAPEPPDFGNPAKPLQSLTSGKEQFGLDPLFKNISEDLSADNGHRAKNDESSSFGPSRNPKATSFFPSSDQLEKLKLKDGTNTIRFLVNTTLRGLQQIPARIFLWPEGTKVVVSDVDGTVTRSDVLGHILPLLGYDWTCKGLCQLYTSIVENGYKILYLSSRSVSLAAQTRSLLQNINQDGVRLPDGPLIVAPDGIFGALTREVICRNSVYFKIAALNALRDVFPGHDPFYAGFGNRDADFISYREAGIPTSKTFTTDVSCSVDEGIGKQHSASKPFVTPTCTFCLALPV